MRTKHKRIAEQMGYAIQSPYNAAAWRKLRAAHRAREPLCRSCMTQGRVTAGAVVDHIVPIDKDGSRFLDATNLQTLCARCHADKTARDEGWIERRAFDANGNPANLTKW